MNVAVSNLRSELSSWLERARRGEDVVITERGLPVARLVAVDAAPLLERLVRDGVVSRPDRPDRPTLSAATRVSATGSVSELVSEQRR